MPQQKKYVIVKKEKYKKVLMQEFKKLETQEIEEFIKRINTEEGMKGLVKKFGYDAIFNPNVSFLVQLELLLNKINTNELKLEFLDEVETWIDEGNLMAIEMYGEEQMKNGSYENNKKAVALLRNKLNRKVEKEKLNSQKTPSAQEVENENQPKCFDELFCDITLAEQEQCIKVLREVTPPVIDKHNNYLLGKRQKGAVVAWVDVMKFRGKIKIVTDAVLSTLLNKKFKGFRLSADGRTLRNTGTTAHKKYHNQFLNLIS